MSNRLNIAAVLPEAYQVLMHLEEYLSASELDKIQVELIKIRASQINGCAFCLNMHIKDALKYGEEQKRINVVSAWREAKKWFSEEDQLILTLTEEITLIANGGVSDETYTKLITLFGEATALKLILAVVSINSWNRIAVSLHMHP